MARHNIQTILPNNTNFPYTIHIISKITKSNKSSSITSIYNNNLTLINTNIPLKTPITNITINLIKKNKHFTILSNILNNKNHLNNINFKITNTKKNITTLQINIKITNITKKIIKTTLTQTHKNQLHILNKINKILNQTQNTISKNTPIYLTIKIHPNKIHNIINKNDTIIHNIYKKSNTKININNNNQIHIYNQNQTTTKKTFSIIKNITTKTKINKIYINKINKIINFDTFINILPNTNNLIHISQITKKKINQINNYLKKNQKISIKILNINNHNHIKLNIKKTITKTTQNKTQPK